LSEVLLGVNLRGQSRSLADLGLSALNPDQMLDLML
jgi:hypothetical protein